MSFFTEREWCDSTLSGDTFRRDVLHGLSQPEKSLPCKYLYDETGARLFESICELDEYYPTRTEIAILRQNIQEIASLLGPACHLVELGSGSGMKTRLLLDHLEHPSRYVPVDVARTQLLESSARLTRDYPGLEVLPVCADFTANFTLLDSGTTQGRTTVFFPGSTIGNFEPREAATLLRRVARMCGTDAAFLIGVDLKKDPELLHLAYNDSRGITAQFNLNILARANRELAADFSLPHFRHRAFYNERAGRVEMHLVSRQSQAVRVDGREIRFNRAESIRTEYSYKYSPNGLRELAARAGFAIAGRWTDERQWFGVYYLLPRT